MKWPDDFINKVIAGDCLEIMKLIPNAVIDSAITDPPYGTVDGRGKVWKGGKVFCPGDWDESLPLEWISFAANLLADARWMFVFTDRIELGTLWREMEKSGLFGKGVFSWIKPTFAPTPRPNFANAWEAAVYATKGPSRRWFGGGYCPNYYLTKGSNFDAHKTAHPTQKPLALMKWIIQKITQPGDIILDPFAGSGTTLVAAKQLGRKYIGIEIDPKYCEIARDRLRQEELF